MRGVQKPGTRTVTTAVRGAFAEDFQLQQTFFPDGESMKRVNRIWEHPLYREAYARIRELEQDREFCGHSAEHFLAVAPAYADL